MPPTKLTPALVRTLGEPGLRSEHFDTIVPGLSLRVSARGAKSWAFVYSLRGRTCRVTLGSARTLSLAEARERAKEERRKVDSGRNPAMELRAARTRSVETVGSLVAQMLERIRLRPSTKKEWARLALKEIQPLWARPAADLTRGEVRSWADRIAQRSGWTANRALEVLSRAYTWGMGLELVAVNPCAGVKGPHHEAPSERVLSTPEVRALWRALDVLGEGQYPDAVRLLLLTGTRRAMVLGARRGEFQEVDDGGSIGDGGRGLVAQRDPEAGDCDVGRTRIAGADRLGRQAGGRAVHPQPAMVSAELRTQARWNIPGGFTGRSKSGRAHVVPLSPQAVTVVRRRLAEAPGDYLFPTYYTRRAGQPVSPHMLALPSAWVRTLKAATVWQLRRELGHGRRARMEPWHLHNLRHTMGTHMTDDLAVHFDVVSLILGHAVSGPRVSRIYNRAEKLAERRAALNLWGSWVEGLAAESSNVLPMRWADRGQE